jgi:solute carrier family 50 protein (sugar transporter)
MVERWVTELFCPTVGVILANLIWFAPMPAIIELRSGSQKELNAFPFGCMVLNCMSWVFYGCLKQNYFIFWANYFGLTLGLYYCLSCAKHSGKKDLNTTATADIVPSTYLPSSIEVFIIGTTDLWSFMGMLVAITLSSRTQGHNKKPSSQDIANLYFAIGVITCACNIVFYFSPLSTIVTVIRTRNAASMSLPLCLTIFINATFWTVYASLGINDIFILIPNVLGLALALAQLALIAVFPLKSITHTSNIAATHVAMPNSTHVGSEPNIEHKRDTETVGGDITAALTPCTNTGARGDYHISGAVTTTRIAEGENSEETIVRARVNVSARVNVCDEMKVEGEAADCMV